MKNRAVFTLLVLLVFQSSCRQSWPPDVVARWDHRDVGLPELENHLSEVLDIGQSGEELVRRYREAAQDLCVREHLLSEYAADTDSKLSAADREFTRRQIIVNSWIKQRVDPEIKISDEEIEAFYEKNTEFSHRPERRFVEHIFRRAADDADETSAQNALAEVRARFVGGETFHALAVEYSQSETGAFGGSLGLVSRGDLHQGAERTVFSLELGEISDPVPVHGGFAVFLVTQIFPEKYFSLSDVRSQIANNLRQIEIKRRLETTAEETPLPPGGQAVQEDAFLEALQSEDSDAKLYSDDGMTYSIGDWRSRLIGGSAESQVAQYTEFLRFQRVYHFVERSGFLEIPGQSDLIGRLLNTALDNRLINAIARELLIERATTEAQKLQSWFDTNRERYQSPIELLIHLIVAPPAGEVEGLADSLRRIGSGYGGGDLDEAAATIPDASVSQAWLGIAALDAYPPKVKATLLTLGPPSCAPVFNIANTLHLFCVEDRKEPEKLTFEEARDQVIEDYVAANEQGLYAEITAEILDIEGFEFNEARVRQVLYAPAEVDE